MNIKSINSRMLIFGTVMGLIGYFILHPISMVIVKYAKTIPLHTHETIFSLAYYHHMPMGIYFSTICIFFGIILSVYIQKIYENAELIKKYERFLPICCHCKAIRDDSGKEKGKGDWIPLENYYHKTQHTDFSHGICPKCAKKFYPDMNIYE